MEHTSMSNNPFALMTDPATVRQTVEQSEQLSRLNQRKCHPLDRSVIHSPSAEIAAFDAKIDRTTIYLPPEQERAKAQGGGFRRAMN